jgi:hypothetical protein
MDIKIENEIRLLKKLGLDETTATMIALASNGKDDVAQQIVDTELQNNKIMMDETLTNMVPFEDTVQNEPSKFICHSNING